MHAAGVVADHAAQRAVIVGGRIGRKSEVVVLGAFAQIVENRGGLHAGAVIGGIEVEDLVQVLGKIHHHGNIAALAGERGASATREQRRAMFAAQRDGGDDVVESFWKHHADGDLAVVAAIGGVESPTAAVETDL